jgi:antitoxin component of MazEF toxin-antitoxin module
MKSDQTIIRKVGASLYIRVPLDWARAHRLKPGDSLVLDLSKQVKIIRRTEEYAVIGQEPEPVAAE